MESRDGLDVTAKKVPAVVGNRSTAVQFLLGYVTLLLSFSSFHITFLRFFPSFVFQQSGLISKEL